MGTPLNQNCGLAPLTATVGEPLNQNCDEPLVIVLGTAPCGNHPVQMSTTTRTTTTRNVRQSIDIGSPSGHISVDAMCRGITLRRCHRAKISNCANLVSGLLGSRAVIWIAIYNIHIYRRENCRNTRNASQICFVPI